MVKSWRLMPHFESGLPHGLAGELAHQLCAPFRLRPDEGGSRAWGAGGSPGRGSGRLGRHAPSSAGV